MPIEVLITVPFSDEVQEQLRGISPKLNLTFSTAQKAADIPPETWNAVEVLYTGHILPEPGQVPALKWIQFHYAGIDRFIDEPILKKNGLKVSTLSGAASPGIAEHILAMMLALGRQIPALINSQKKAEWPKDRYERFAPVELNGKTVGIVGYGSIGRQLAWLLQPFGVTILATKRDAMHTEDKGYTPEGTGDPGGNFVHRLYPPEALRSMARECQYLVVTAPLTRKTQKMVDEKVLNVLKPGAFLVDVSRGGIVHQPALFNALKDGPLAGAALDVFPEEPLPANNPLWKLPNIIISPHIAGNSPNYNVKAAALFKENLYRYLASLPLYNLFDPQRGY
jgi:phosphoglycerate dehydrogenase-like enzyme